MRFPKKGSQIDRTLRAIHEAGSMTRPQIKDEVPGLGDTALAALIGVYQLPRKGNRYFLPTYLTQFYDGKSAEEIRAVIPTPITVRVFRPLTGYGASLRAAAERRPGCELRDVSFLTCSVSLNPWKVNQ